MIKENIKLKDELTLQEIANFTEELVNACFDEDETGDCGGAFARSETADFGRKL